ncbi:MAG: hypothetical protein HQL32_08960, partial [Planctomycetes bacterium]|nr:hypothetical protein [Planctomycetota bacterium]
MIRSWVVFCSECLIFSFIILLISFLYLEPHFKNNFKEILEAKLNLTPEIDSFHFSPTGKMEGGRLQLKGETAQLGAIQFEAQSFQIIPKEFIYHQLWKHKENFDWQKVPYHINLKDISLYIENKDLNLFLPEATLDINNDDIKVQLAHASLTYPEGIFSINDITLETDLSNSLSLSFSNLYGMKESNLIECEKISALFNITQSEQKWWTRMEEIVIGSASVKGAQKIQLNALRLTPMDAQKWNLLASGSFNDKEFSISPQLKLNADDNWSISGSYDLPNTTQSFNYNINGPIAQLGHWSLSLYDENRNLLNLDINCKKEGEYIGT